LNINYIKYRDADANTNASAALSASIKQYNFTYSSSTIANLQIGIDADNFDTVFGFQNNYFVTRGAQNTQNSANVYNLNGTLHSIVPSIGNGFTDADLSIQVTDNYLIVKEFSPIQEMNYSYISLYKKQVPGNLFTLVETLSVGSTVSNDRIELFESATDDGFVILDKDTDKILYLCGSKGYIAKIISK
jgi:hypothetical protein